MIEDIPLIDVHIHASRLSTLKLSREEWAPFADSLPLAEVYDSGGSVDPARFDSYLEREGVDRAILLCEYSPKVTGINPVEDLLPIVEFNPKRFSFLANVNPHFHYPLAGELERQLELGAVGVKIHPVHGGFPPNDAAVYPAYGVCQERGIPVVIHCGTSVYPGATNRYADPALVEDVARDFPSLTIVLAHGGRGWWYDTAAFMSLMRPNVWIDISGLPPRRLPHYYRNFDLDRLATRFIFGTDWPGVPGVRTNAVGLMELGFDRKKLEGIFFRNALEVYRLPDPGVV